MKNFILMALLVFATSFAFSQNINDKYTEEIKSSETGIIPVKVGNKWRKLSTGDTRFNPFLTEFNYPYSADSIAKLNTTSLKITSSNDDEIGFSVLQNNFHLYTVDAGKYGFNGGRWLVLEDTTTNPHLFINNPVSKPYDYAKFANNTIEFNSESDLSTRYIRYQDNFNTDFHISTVTGLAYNKTSTSTNGISLQFVSHSNKNVSLHFTDLENTETVSNIEAATILEINETFVSSEKVFNANAGINIVELSYTPSSSTDLQAEASSSEIGTSWLLDVSGSWYLVTKITSTKLARTPFAEW